MAKLFKILKINILALIAIPLLLLATVFKLIAKSLEKLPLLIGLAVASLFLVAATSVSLNAKSILTALAFVIAAFILFGLFILLMYWIISLISAVVALAWTAVVAFFDSLHNMTYAGYLRLFAICETDYQFLSLNGKKYANAMICPFYTVLRALRWVVITAISLSIPAAILCSVALVAVTLFDLNQNISRSFGFGLVDYIKKCSATTIIDGLFIYLVFIAICVIALMAFATEWYEWAQDLKTTGDDISKEIADLQNNSIQAASGTPSEVESSLEWIQMIEKHAQDLPPLGQRVKELLDKNDSTLLKSAWNIYIRNLQFLSEECSSKKGITVEQLKILIPQIKKLDKQRRDVVKQADRLAEELNRCNQDSAKTCNPDESDADAAASTHKMKSDYEALKKMYNSGKNKKD